MFPQIITFSVLVALAENACICHEDVPFWKAPCGSNVNNSSFDDSDVKLTEAIEKSMAMKSLKEIKQNLKIVLFFYEEEKYTTFYKNLDPAYVTGLKWLSGKNDINMNIHNISEIHGAIQCLYSDLQKYAIVFEQILKEEIDDVTKGFVDRIITYMKPLLCEVQQILVWLQVPIPQNINPVNLPQDYKTVERTERTIRNFQAIKKYGNYIKLRLQFIKSTRTQFRKRRQPGHKKRTSPSRM